jgi:hypothetical protein
MADCATVEKRVRLSVAQLVLLDELAESNGNPDGAWYFPHGKARTLAILAVHGFAKQIEWNAHKVGYSITDAGLRWLGLTTRRKHKPRKP